MSSGAVLALISADGKQDNLINATGYLNARLKSIAEVRRSRGEDPTPTLADVEKTHIVFTHARYRPHAAIALEYQKCTSQGAATLGNTVTFNIAQFGEFISDMAVHVKLAVPTHTGNGDTLNHPSFRYVDYVGERLSESVKFEVNGGNLDTIDYNTYVFHRNFKLQASDKLAWDRMMGQEEPVDATLSQASGEQEPYRVQMKYTDGNQTPKSGTSGNTHASLEVIVPLLFWFNTDPRCAIPSVAIPAGGRFVKYTLASIANVFVAQGRGTGALALESTGTTALTAPTVELCQLYVNNLFMNPEIHEIYIKRITFSLIRVHLRQSYPVANSSGNFLMSEIKWPVECLFIGFRPDVTNYAWSTTGLGTSNTWHKFSQGALQKKELTSIVAGLELHTAATGYAAADYPLVSSTTIATPVAEDSTVGGIDTTTNVFVRALGAQVKAHTWSKTVDDLTVKAFGITLYEQFTTQFYNAYMPFTYGDRITAPSDVGAMFVSFAQYPGQFQPSGHLNVSRARELYISFNSSYFTTLVTGTMIVEAQAINFLLVSAGSASLRFST